MNKIYRCFCDETPIEPALSVAVDTDRAALSVSAATDRAALSVGVKIEVWRELLYPWQQTCLCRYIQLFDLVSKNF